MSTVQGFKEEHSTAYENCLLPLLTALKWRGDRRALKEAMPHFTRINTATSFCNVLAHLNFTGDAINGLTSFDERLLPSLLVTSENDVLVALSAENGQVKIYDGVTSKENLLSVQQFAQLAKTGRLFIFKPTVQKEDDPDSQSRSWFWYTFRKNKGLVYSAIFLSLILNILILATPIFVMSVYDKVIGSSSFSMLNQFGFGVTIALIGMYLIYRIRAKHLAVIGARCDKTIGDRVVNQLLYLSPSYTETATPGAQVSRIKDFDRVREFFSGPFLAVFFELPFIFIAVILIAVIAGPLVLVPILMIILYVLVGFFLAFKLRGLIKSSAQSFASLQDFLLESIETFRAIKYTASISVWLQRYRDYSAKTSLNSVRMSVFDAIANAFSEFVMIGSGLSVLTFGAVMAMNGKLSIGAMLAVMIIIWRILAPIKTIFNSLPRLLQLRSSIRQINRLMSLQSEADANSTLTKNKVRFKGEISLQRVSMRYPAAYTPSLMGVSFTIKAGSIVALVGRNGSGKSTILKLLLGLYYPQAGGVLIDGREIRQFSPLELRSGIGYLSQYPELFYGTVAANLRLGDPTASIEAMRQATQDAGILTEIESLPQGFDTPLTDQTTQRLASSFRQSLCLARAYLRDTSILLLDEPGNTLDNEADLQLVKHLEQLRGEKTVILVTHRPSHLSRVDSVILMDQGQMVLQGPPDEVLNKIPLELL